MSVGGAPTLLGVPFDAASSFLRGAAAAPPLIREALRSPASNMWTELGVDLAAPGALADEGDLAIDDALRGAELNGHQRAQADRFGVEVIEVIDMRAWSAGKRVVAPANSAAYLSIDCDAFDPAFAPGVSHREPGGLSPRDVLDAIQRLDAQIVGADVVECNPSRDSAGVTAALCAKLVKEIAGRMTLAGPEAR